MSKLQITPIDPRVKKPVSFVIDSGTKKKFLIGRDIGNADVKDLDIIISDRTVSKLHAILEADEAPNGVNWYLTDVSTNGTQINGTHIPRDTPIRISGFSDEVICGLKKCGFIADSAVTDSGFDFLHRADSEPTINKTMQEEIQRSHDYSRPWYAQTLDVILNGPKGCPQALWWFLLLLVTVFCFYVWVKYGGAD